MSQDVDVNHHHAERAPSKRQERRSQEVWASNLEEEIARMYDVAETYQHVAMDTQFPGIVACPMGPFNDYVEYNYQVLKCNVDLTKVIQIGLTFSDAKGNRPKGISTWRFNFTFDADSDFHTQESIDGLRNTRGFDLAKHQTQGIDIAQFGELVMTSGLVLNDEIRWITFCGSSDFSERPQEADSSGNPGEPPWVTFCGMYNFGFFLLLVTAQPLPDEVNGFRESLDLFFPSRCDVGKHLNRLPALNGGDPTDPKRRSYFCNAHHILEAFFRLPDSVRRTAFDREEEPEAVAEVQHNPRGSRGKHRPHKPIANGHVDPVLSNGTAANGSRRPEADAAPLSAS